MSWDAIIFGGKTAPILDNQPDDWRPPVIGTVQEIRQRLDAICGPLEWDSFGVTVLERNGSSVEISVGTEPAEVMTFQLSVRGGAEIFAVIFDILDQTGWHMWDMQTGAFLHEPRDIDRSFGNFTAFRDEVLQSYATPPSKPAPLWRRALGRLLGNHK